MPEVEEAHPFNDLIGGGEPQVEEDGLPHFFKELSKEIVG